MPFCEGFAAKNPYLLGGGVGVGVITFEKLNTFEKIIIKNNYIRNLDNRTFA